MIKKIKRCFYNFLYSLPFGMKAADDEIFTQKVSSNSDNIGIHQVIQQNSLAKDLRKGEVTQQVEELRYRTYAVERESYNYDYLGEGVAIKKEIKEFDNTNFHLIQENKLNCKSINDEMKRVDTEEYSNDTYTLNVIYDSTPKFKLEKYCTYFEFDVDEYKATLIMRFITTPIKGDISSYGFIKELEYITRNIGKEYDYNHINMIDFVTYKCIGDVDCVRYTLHDISLSSISYSLDEKECYVKFNVKYFKREDLTSKFYSKTMDEKYKSKEKKELVLDLTNQERVKYCSVCNKQMSVYDGDITEETYGYPICKECLENTLLLENNLYNLNKE